MTSYNLTESMTDRVNFDNAQEQYAQDLLDSMSTDLGLSQDPDDFVEIGWEAFQIDLENGAVEVDDLDEAKARFFSSFRQGVIDWQDNQ